MTQPIIIVTDFETTGLPPDAAVCEIGTCSVFYLGDTWNVGEPISTLVHPGRFIPPDSSAIHHIIDADVASQPTADMALRNLARMDVDIFAAHRADFERTFFNPPGSDWICTYKCALVQWPDAPSHSNQALRYWFNLPVDRTVASPAHRAGPDAYVSAHILVRLLQYMTPEQMIEISSKPALLPKVLFGKYHGKRWSEVDPSYLDWCLKQDMDADVKHTCRHHLQLHLQNTERRTPAPVMYADIIGDMPPWDPPGEPR